MRSIKKYGETIAYELSSLDVENLQNYLEDIEGGIEAFLYTKDKSCLNLAHNSAAELSEYFRDIWNYEE